MDTRDLSGKVAVVTGAASGIGRATALALAERGADLALCDLNEGGLKETADRIEALGRRAFTARADVSRAEAVSEFADATFAALGRVDILVNNAGIGVGGNFVDVPLEEWDTIIGINLKGVVHGCYFFAPRMIEAGRGGHIVNIASMAGYFATPSMSAYDATKFAVIGLSEALRAELSVHRIGVTAICPGVINTPIVHSSRMYGPLASEENRERGARVFARRNYSPERVARGILKAVQRNRGVAPVSPEARVGYWIKRLFPWIVSGAGRIGARRAEREARRTA
jgi:NAD(P)-dependent dehydrogenase (short-subunit alcohol dehydrogenase family)